MHEYAQKLIKIIKASDLTQEELSKRLGFSFPTINSWINSKSEPRKKSKLKVDQLFVEFFGADSITKEVLEKTKSKALSKKPQSENF